MIKTKEITNGQFDELTLDNSHFAYKNGLMFNVWQTKKSHCAGGCIGKIRFVLGFEDKVRATAWPLMNFDNGYELVTLETIERYRKIVNAYDNM